MKPEEVLAKQFVDCLKIIDRTNDQYRKDGEPPIKIYGKLEIKVEFPDEFIESTVKLLNERGIDCYFINKLIETDFHPYATYRVRGIFYGKER